MSRSSIRHLRRIKLPFRVELPYRWDLQSLLQSHSHCPASPSWHGTFEASIIVKKLHDSVSASATRTSRVVAVVMHNQIPFTLTFPETLHLVDSPWMNLLIQTHFCKLVSDSRHTSNSGMTERMKWKGIVAVHITRSQRTSPYFVKVSCIVIASI